MVERWASHRQTDDKNYWRQLLTKQVQLLPSVAIYSPAGRAVSWAMLYLEGNLGNAYTESEFRGQGLNDILSAAVMLKTVRYSNQRMFTYVRTDNHVVPKKFKSFAHCLEGKVQFLHYAT